MFLLSFLELLHLKCEDDVLDAYADPSQIMLEENYVGPEISIPFNLDTIWDIIHYFQEGKVLVELKVQLALFSPYAAQYNSLEY